VTNGVVDGLKHPPVPDLLILHHVSHHLISVAQRYLHANAAGFSVFTITWSGAVSNVSTCCVPFSVSCAAAHYSPPNWSSVKIFIRSVYRRPLWAAAGTKRNGGDEVPAYC